METSPATKLTLKQRLIQALRFRNADGLTDYQRGLLRDMQTAQQADMMQALDPAPIQVEITVEELRARLGPYGMEDAVRAFVAGRRWHEERLRKHRSISHAESRPEAFRAHIRCRD